MSKPFQGFTITLPECTAQEVQILTPLAELVLCCGADRIGQRDHSGFQDVESSPLANALLELAVALNEVLLPDFEDHFRRFWLPEDALHWQAAAFAFDQAAAGIRDAVQSMIDHGTGADYPEPRVSRAPSGPPPRRVPQHAGDALGDGGHTAVGAGGQTTSAGGDV